MKDTRPPRAATGPARLPILYIFCHCLARCFDCVIGFSWPPETLSLPSACLIGADSNIVGTVMLEIDKLAPVNNAQNMIPSVLATLTLSTVNAMVVAADRGDKKVICCEGWIRLATTSN